MVGVKFIGSREMMVFESGRVRVVIRDNWAGVVRGSGKEISIDIDEERLEGVRGWGR